MTDEHDHPRPDPTRARLDAADAQDATASARDLAALARDQAAEVRDLSLAQRDVAGQPDTAEQRDSAAQDRRDSANDREQAASARLRARVDREALARELALTETDPLTGARTRAAGLTELDHDLDRCRRTGGLLVVAYVDVVGLKALNDSEGHAAGDELLKRVVAVLREHLRSYDLIMRLGGDEFLCAMSRMTLADARRRFRAIAGALADAPEARSIRTGFAALTHDDTGTELIARADSELADGVRPRHDDRS